MEKYGGEQGFRTKNEEKGEQAKIFESIKKKDIYFE